MKPQRVRLFIKPFCSWCHQATRWLKQKGIEFETFDVIADDAAMAEMVRLSGQDLAPVIDVDGQILADFGADELEDWWHRQKYHRN
jgi:glutaredoxin 3